MKNCLSLVFVGSIIISCSSPNNSSMVAYWKPVKVKVWDSYRHNPVSIDLATKSFSFNKQDSILVTLMTEGYKDSLLLLLQKSYLNLRSDNTFQLEDHGFLSQALLDSTWQGTKSGHWSIDLKKSILSLTQSTLIVKEYTILSHSGNFITIGERYPGEPKPITEITLSQ